ncbi:MAG: DnaB-like helicase C-terminal domain-containing protein [Oscillospiraceae bacterium]
MDSNALYMAEYAVVGTLLHNPEKIGETLTILLPADFDQLGTRGLYDAACELFLAGAPVDSITVQARAGDAYSPMMQQVMQFDEPEKLSYYCELIKDQSRLKRMQTLAGSIALAETSGDARKYIDQLNAATVRRSHMAISSAKEMVMEFLERMESEETPEYLSWGIADLDRALYAELGDMIVLGGYPNAGKTLLSLQFALHLAQKYRVGYYSLETDKKKLVDRLFAYKSQTDMGHIKRHDLTMDDATRIADAAGQLYNLTFDSISASGASVRDIQATALSLRHQVVFIDYLQLCAERGSSRYEEVTRISRDLHIMAQSNKITVIALAQLSRVEKKKDGTPIPPSMSSFKESGQIEQDADVALLLWPEDFNNNASNRVLKIGKNKEGVKKTIHLSFDGARQTLTPLDPVHTDVAREFSAAGRAVKESLRREAKQQLQTSVFDEIPDEPGVPFPADSKEVLPCK